MAGRIEFLDEAPPPHESGAHTPRPPRRRRLTAVLVLVGVLVAGLLVARALTGQADHRTQPDPRPTDHRRPGVSLAQCSTYELTPGVEQTVDAPSGQPVTIEEPPASERTAGCSATAARCPAAGDGQNACATTSEVPRAVLLAVWSQFPSASLEAARSETIRENGALWYRYVRFRLAVPDDAQLSVEITDGHPNDRAVGEWDDGGGQFSRAGLQRGGYQIYVTVVGPSGGQSLLTEQYRLAHERGLVAK